MSATAPLIVTSQSQAWDQPGHRASVASCRVPAALGLLRPGLRLVRGGHRLCGSTLGSCAPDIGWADGCAVVDRLGTAQLPSVLFKLFLPVG